MTDIHHEQQAEVNAEDAPRPTSKVLDTVLERDIEELDHPEASVELQHAEREQLDT